MWAFAVFVKLVGLCRRLRGTNRKADAEHGSDEQIEPRRDIAQSKSGLVRVAFSVAQPQAPRVSRRVLRGIGNDVVGLGHCSTPKRHAQVASPRSFIAPTIAMSSDKGEATAA